MKVFNGISKGQETSELILCLTPVEAKRLVLVLALAAAAKPEDLKSLRRQAKPFAEELDKSALCF